MIIDEMLEDLLDEEDEKEIEQEILAARRGEE